MSIYSGALLSDVSPNRGSKENERPTKLLYPSGGSYFVEGTGSDKLALQGVTSEHSGDTHDGSFGGGGGPDHESLNKLLATLEAEDGGQMPIAEEVVPVGVSQKIPDDWLKTDPAIGLTHDQALQRRKKCGWNQMKEKKRNVFKQFSMFFVGPIQFVMEAACVLAAYLWDWIDLGVIVGLLLLNAVIGFTQDYTAGNIVKELQNDLALKCDVRRNGVLEVVEAIALVPGDIVHLEEGTIVPADGRIVTKHAHLQVDQSAMTGESLAVNKHVGEVIYQSSTIKRGESFMIVTNTGDGTFVGRSAALVNAASAGKGHFTEVLGSIGRRLLGLVIATLFVVWVSCFYRSLHLTKILTFTLAITIIGVPVGLPAVVTTTMAVGAAVLARKKAIVQNLSAIESLAGVEILCTDKTGTLTQNKLSLSEPYTVGNVGSDELMLAACLAASRKEKGLDAIDKALLKALKHYPLTKDMIPTFKVVEFTPFDPVSKKTTSVVRSQRGEHIICVKGAPAVIIKLVSEVDGVIPEETATEYNNKVAEFARRGFRSLGVARKRVGSHWELLGIMPCSDPPRHDTAKTMAEAIDLGLRIKMLTGDAVGIAKETSRQLGLGENIYNSERLGLGGGGELPGHKFFDFVEAADGFAEVFPQHKYNVVDILQMRGYLVAMTGDGVNDAPSLKKADAGIAVEGASDAARSAADIVFREPGLSAIIDAIKTSRQIFHRMYAYVVYRIALSLHLEIFLGLWIAIYNQSLKIQLVVFIAIFADIATLAIAYDKAPFSRSPVKWNLPKMWGISIILGIILAAGSWICISTTLNGRLGLGIIQEKGPVHSVLFLEIVLTENWLILITRAGAQPFWTSVPSWQLVLAILLVDALATLFCIFGWFNVPEWTDTVVMTSASTIIRVWVFSLGVFFAMAGVYYLLADSQAFDRLMHGQWPCRRSRKDRRRSYELEDIVVAMQRASNVHESVV